MKRVVCDTLRIVTFTLKESWKLQSKLIFMWLPYLKQSWIYCTLILVSQKKEKQTEQWTMNFALRQLLQMIKVEFETDTMYKLDILNKMRDTKCFQKLNQTKFIGKPWSKYRHIILTFFV